jgi:hypothetical protein
MGNEEKGVAEKIVLELANKITSPVYVMFTSFIVDKAYFSALEFMSIFKTQEGSIRELMETGVAEFDFYGYNKFTIEEKKIIDEMYTRFAKLAADKEDELRRELNGS